MRRTFGDATHCATQSQTHRDVLRDEQANDLMMKSIDFTDVDVSRAGNYLDIESSTSTLSDCRLTRRKASSCQPIEEDVSLAADKRTWHSLSCDETGDVTSGDDDSGSHKWIAPCQIYLLVLTTAAPSHLSVCIPPMKPFTRASSLWTIGTTRSIRATGTIRLSGYDL